MQNEVQTKENLAPETCLATETEADAQAARIVTERLNALTESVERARRLALRRNSVAGICPMLLMIAGVCSVNENPYIGMVVFFLLFPVLFTSFSLMTKGWSRSLPEFDAEEIATLGGLRALAPLFDVLQAPLSHKQEQAILAALATLLPQMKASDAPLLTPDARLIINKWLVSVNLYRKVEGYSDALLIAALKALEQVGDFRAIPYVERLANMNPRPFHNPEVLQAAIDCLPTLRANCGEVEAARTLLRASHAEDACPETLLRPASHVETAAQDLLRGAEKP